MKLKHVILVAIAGLVFSMLSACTAGAMSGSSWPGLAADETTAYLANGTFVYAVRLDDGMETWRYPEKADNKRLFFSAPLLTSDGQLIIGSSGSDHTLFSLNQKNGSGNWMFTGAKGHWIASPLEEDETIYAPNGDGTLYVIGLDGSLRWSLHLGDLLWSQPRTDGSLIYIASLDHKLYAVDPQRQQLAWKVTISGAIPGSPGIGDNGTLFVGSFGSKLDAIDITRHDIRWSSPTKGWIWGSPAVDAETIYFGDLSGHFYALDAASGEEKWTPLQPDGPIVGSPLVTPDYLAITTEVGSVYAIDREGKIVWNRIIGGKLYSPAVAAGNLILVAPLQADFMIAALDKNGSQVWTFKPVKK